MNTSNFEVMIVGDQNVGKTSLLIRWMKGYFSSAVRPTTGFIYMTECFESVNLGNVKVSLELWDTSGQKRYQKNPKLLYKSVNAVILAFDLTNYTSFLNLERYLGYLKLYSVRVKILLGTKADLSSSRQIDYEEAKRFSEDSGMDFYMETSALSGANLDDDGLLERLAILLLEDARHQNE